MNISDKNIDGGKAFDWGRTSVDYARFRDIYPRGFYDRIAGAYQAACRNRPGGVYGSALRGDGRACKEEEVTLICIFRSPHPFQQKE